MKILHSADWHLDAPMLSLSPRQREKMRKHLLEIPEKIAELCRRENCSLMLLAGDLFDGPYTMESYTAVYRALEEVEIPVMITPGNHDFMDDHSPWNREIWPENVYIFTKPELTSVAIPELQCRVYGAGYDNMDCRPLLDHFTASGKEKWQIGLFHGDPVTAGSPYSPVTSLQVEQSGLSYLALGHVHKRDSFRAGQTLCAWPGCPMGRGYDETGEKGALIAELGEAVSCRFVPLGFPEFQDLEVRADPTPEAALDCVLPPVGNENFYRITLTGTCPEPDISVLGQRYSRFPNLTLRDRTVRPVDLWQHAGEDSFEGMYFGLLQQRLRQAAPEDRETILLAARISRQILEGQEEILP